MTKMLIDYIRPDGQFETANGTFFAFVYEFAGGVLGTANHKTANSPFAIGQEVYVEVVGQSPKGVSKLKLSKNPPDPRFAAAPAAPAAPAAAVIFAARPVSGAVSAPVVASTAIHPATAGMAVKEACAFILTTVTDIDISYLKGEQFRADLYDIAKSISAVARKLEAGTPLPSAARPAPKPVAKPVAPAAPAPAPAQEINDEDVPF